MLNNFTFLFLYLLKLHYISSQYIKYDIKNSISILTITNHKSSYGLNFELINELDKILENINKTKIKVLIITGFNNIAFTVNENSEIASFSYEKYSEFSTKISNLLRKIEKLHAVVIAAIDGHLLGLSLEVALSCDIRICSESTDFIMINQNSNVGCMYSFCGVQRLARVLGVGTAKDILFTRRSVEAKEALRIRLVDIVYKDSEMLNNIKKIAEKIAKNSVEKVKCFKSEFLDIY